ncbi:patatin-like phospholipase family protein [Orenia marismortui]|uniref:patatin-like phospholipase family protein n=1 Tax=Orenia marismortui TaxID=46469 RepID=UPI00038145EB|nr:patatin-like phospholipase family protein [Orenia marismortui]
MKPTLGLALGAGSARGLAHIGVLKAFEEEEIKIDYIGGTSMGSIIGGFYSAGQELDKLEKLATHLKWEHLTDITVPRKGLIAGNKIRDFFDLLTQNKDFSDLQIPFVALAADIETGEEVIIDKGLVADAMRASMSVPGIYIPYELEGKKLVDGAVINRVPVSPVRELGADLVIGVEVSHNLIHGSKVNNIFDVIMNSIDIMQQELAKHKNTGADLLIIPEVGNIPSTGLDHAERSIDLGYKAAKELIPKIRKLIEEWDNNEKDK